MQSKARDNNINNTYGCRMQIVKEGRVALFFVCFILFCWAFVVVLQSMGLIVSRARPDYNKVQRQIYHRGGKTAPFSKESMMYCLSQDGEL